MGTPDLGPKNLVAGCIPKNRAHGLADVFAGRDSANQPGRDGVPSRTTGVSLACAPACDSPSIMIALSACNTSNCALPLWRARFFCAFVCCACTMVHVYTRACTRVLQSRDSKYSSTMVVVSALPSTTLLARRACGSIVLNCVVSSLNIALPPRQLIPRTAGRVPVR